MTAPNYINAPKGREALAEPFRKAKLSTGAVTKADLGALEPRLKAWLAGMLLLQAGLVAALVKLL